MTAKVNEQLVPETSQFEHVKDSEDIIKDIYEHTHQKVAQIE